MFKNNIWSDYTGITDEDLTAIEKEYNFKFPEDLKEFYLTYNGGNLEKKEVCLQKDDWISFIRFHGFYSIKKGYSILENKLKINYLDDWWIKWLIPFGYDEGGNEFCFSTRDYEYGCIYYFLSDDYDEDYPDDSIIKVGENFTDFINSMK